MDEICEFLDVRNTAYANAFFEVVQYFGTPYVAVPIFAMMFLYGHFFRVESAKNASLLIIFSFIATSLAANLLKLYFDFPRPSGDSFGFPSGHTSVAFSLASSLGIAYPNLIFVFYLFATLTAIARLYFGSHFPGDVIVGAAIGVLITLALNRYHFKISHSHKTQPISKILFLMQAPIFIVAIVFFYDYENSVYDQKFHQSENFNNNSFTIDFGRTEYRKYYIDGWSDDEKFQFGEIERDFVWSVGEAAKLVIPNIPPDDHNMIMTVLPFSPQALACQHTEVHINGELVGDVRLVDRWNSYSLYIEGEHFRSSSDELEIVFKSKTWGTPASWGINNDTRHLTIALDKIVFEKID